MTEIERAKKRFIFSQETLDAMHEDAKDPEKARAIMIELGLLNPDGSLSINYYPEEAGGKEWPPKEEP